MSATTYSMLRPTNPAFRSDNPRGGILLNAIRPHHSQSPSSSQSPLSPTYTTPSSPSSTDSSQESLARKSSPTRRITFAPLPKPREYDSDQLPVIVLDQPHDGLSYNHPDAASSLSGDDMALSTALPESPLITAKKSSSWGYSTKKLLRPLYKPLQKATSLDVDKGGALGLFRSSSRESTASSVGTLTDTQGAPLSRRMSTGSTPSDYASHSLALTPVLSENGGVAAGTRMLNGRVYGGQRIRAQQRAQEKTAEPEFVEWGYGGMGSNRGASASSTYAGVQSSQKNVVAAEDGDDGSGMGWVRKRREAREREKREREEKEAEEKHKDRDASPVDEAAPQPSPEAEATPAMDQVEEVSSLAPAQTSPDPSQPLPADEHITQAVTVPIRPHHLHHHHSRHSHSQSRPSTGNSGRSTPMISRPSNDSSHTVTSIAPSVASGPSSISALRNRVEANVPEMIDSQSEEDDDDDSSTEDGTEKDFDCREDDDEEESDRDAGERKTSLCAGVEKISRHKE